MTMKLDIFRHLAQTPTAMVSAQMDGSKPGNRWTGQVAHSVRLSHSAAMPTGYCCGLESSRHAVDVFTPGGGYVNKQIFKPWWGIEPNISRH